MHHILLSISYPCIQEIPSSIQSECIVCMLVDGGRAVNQFLLSKQEQSGLLRVMCFKGMKRQYLHSLRSKDADDNEGP